VDGEVDSVHVKRIGMNDLVGYVYIVIVDMWPRMALTIRIYVDMDRTMTWTSMEIEEKR
jgi:hypothetical protein